MSTQSLRPPVVARPAATLVLMRRPPSGAQGVEILMLERSAKADFTPSMFVFPGGGVEAEDVDARARRLTPRFGAQDAFQRLPDAGSAEQALGYYVAAVRETFEESGILLARTERGDPADLPEAKLAAGRKACLPGGIGFLGWMAEERLAIAAEDLIYFAHWITPKAVPKRFDTRFFLAEAPRDTPVLADQAEIVAHRWATPEEALAEHAAGRMAMIEPTFQNVMLFRDFSSPAEAKAAFSQRAVQSIMPQLQILPDGRRKVILPWDPAYVPEPEST